jgi:hypothetical protein
MLSTMVLAGDPRLKDLDHGTLLLLAVMADTAQDDLYYRGWPYLARWLGYDTYDAAAKEAVRWRVAELRARGLVAQGPRRGGSRGNRVYRIHLIRALS